VCVCERERERENIEVLLSRSHKQIPASNHSLGSRIVPNKTFCFVAGRLSGDIGTELRAYRSVGFGHGFGLLLANPCFSFKIQVLRIEGFYCRKVKQG